MPSSLDSDIDFFLPGQIKERAWYGETGMQHVRTIKEPKQSIPTFAETVALLMRVCRAVNVFLELTFYKSTSTAREPACQI
jgi:hypothetical protein